METPAPPGFARSHWKGNSCRGFSRLSVPFLESEAMPGNRALSNWHVGHLERCPLPLRRESANCQLLIANLLKPVPLTDKFGRAITDLRISVTDRCNYKCVYCRTGNEGALYGDLPFADYLRMARVLVGLGIEKVRITGGEPLLRKGVDRFRARIGETSHHRRRRTRHRADHQRPSPGRDGTAAQGCRPAPRDREHGRGRSRPFRPHYARARRIRQRAGRHPGISPRRACGR